MSANGSRADDAHARLKQAILQQHFRPGDRMREAELAAWLGVSRTPVREALGRLEAEGLLSVTSRHPGLVVASLDQQQVSELYAVRELLEGFAARLAARHASDAEIATLRDLLARQNKTPANDADRLAHINKSFHEAIYRAARNRYLSDMLRSIESALALLPATTYAHPGRPQSALTEHTAIVDAIADRDVDQAEDAARSHIRAAELVRLLMITGVQADLVPTGTGQRSARTKR